MSGLTFFEVLDIARKLRNEAELSWSSTARVMEALYGIKRTPRWWKQSLSKSGPVRLSPRGRPFARRSA